MKIFIAGSGKLAKALLTSDLIKRDYEVSEWDASIRPDKKSIIVHAGSGRQLNECMEFCAATKSILIELSTGSEAETAIVDFPMIICPNTSILVLKTLHMLRSNGKQFTDYGITITESHQSTKKTEPGTAYAFAQALDYPFDKIISVRDPEIQLRQIQIPDAYLDKHAYHKIVIKDGDDEITLETKVLGHQSYAKGVKNILDSIRNFDPDNKKYTILDLIDLGVL